MHEMALSQDIVAICQRNAGGRPVSLVVVEIGQLSGVVPEAVVFCFEACSAGTLVAGARLQIQPVAGKGRCLDCRHESPLERLFDPCCNCGSFRIEVLSGQEVRVREIDVVD
ncbi:MAG: hydrogenase maturation nickel metallochaperone HypA [Geobacter sp.]